MPTVTKGEEKKDEIKIEMTTPSKPTSSAQALPETGELESLFGLSVLAILASVGLIAPAIRRREQ